jgi:hypothetical protein
MLHHVPSDAEGQQLVIPSVRASRTVLAWAMVPSRDAKVKINVQCSRRDVGWEAGSQGKARLYR